MSIKRILYLTIVLLLLTSCANKNEKTIEIQEEEVILDGYQYEDENVDYEQAIANTMAFDYNDLSKAPSTLKELSDINPDIVYIMKIRDKWFPIANNSEYSHKNRESEYDVFGTPFIESDNISIITSHSSIRGGKDIDLMFTFLKKYKDYDYYLEQPSFTLETDETIDHYLVVAFINTDLTDGWIGFQMPDLDKNILLQYMKDNATWIVNTNISENDDFLLLVTCDLTKQDARNIVVCKKLLSQ